MVDSPPIVVPKSRRTGSNGRRLALARRLPRPVHYVLSGGGSHGAVQWGQLQALAETDVTPDSLIGTSAGALTGSVIAEDPVSGVHRLSYIWAQLNERHMVGEGSVARQIIGNARRIALFSSDSQRQTIAHILGVRRFEQLTLPFATVATDLATGQAKVFDEGDLINALMASSAVPGAMPPVRIHGRLYCDGLASANLPIIQAVERGAGSIVVLDTGARDIGDMAQTPLKVATRVAALLNENQSRRAMTAASADVPVVELPTPPGLGTTMDFRHSLRIGARAWQDARDYLSRLCHDRRSKLRPGHYGPDHTDPK